MAIVDVKTLIKEQTFENKEKYNKDNYFNVIFFVSQWKLIRIHLSKYNFFYFECKNLSEAAEFDEMDSIIIVNMDKNCVLANFVFMAAVENKTT